MPKPIEGRVAEILDEYTIVINVGGSKGVKQGMSFVVFAKGDDVKDPETGESLGKWEMVKGLVTATHVQQKMCVCVGKTPETEQMTSDPSTHTLSAEMIAVSLHLGGPRIQRAQKLNVKESEMVGMPQVGPIGVGDWVRSVEELVEDTKTQKPTRKQKPKQSK